MRASRTLGLLTLPSMALLCLGLISCSGGQANKAGKITKANYDKISNGMTEA
jgi:hypothetical protein